MKKRLFIVLSLILLSSILAQGGVKLPSIISENMVLQQNASIKLWGWASPGEEVTITSSWSNELVTVVTGEDGKWSIYIQTPECRRNQSLRITSSSDQQGITIGNILIGEVWLASGQSNMEFEMRPHPVDKWMTGASDWEKEVADANYPDIHLFKVEEAWNYNAPVDNCQGEWVVCSPQVAETYSAIAFLFARELHQALERPVGVILCAFGGTHAESWTRDEIMRNDPIYDRVYKNYSPEKTEPKGYQHKVPAAIWNAMVNPILGYTIKGNIWYQAESNAWRSEDYQHIFVKMVNDWRSLWGQERLPFYYMQVAPFGDLPGKVRLEQAEVWEKGKLDDIGMATAIDVGDSLDIHPKNKREPAHRFVLWALAKEYGVDMECEGPLLQDVKIKNDKLVLTFKNSDGLYIKDDAGNKSKSGVRYLMIAGEDGQYYPALTKLKGEKLIAWSPEVPHPVHIKYCTEDYCRGTIYNKHDLPAYPFEY